MGPLMHRPRWDGGNVEIPYLSGTEERIMWDNETTRRFSRGAKPRAQPRSQWRAALRLSAGPPFPRGPGTCPLPPPDGVDGSGRGLGLRIPILVGPDGWMDGWMVHPLHPTASRRSPIILHPPCGDVRSVL